MATATALNTAFLLPIRHGPVMFVRHWCILLRQLVAGVIMTTVMTHIMRLVAIMHSMGIMCGCHIAMATGAIFHALARMGADGLVRQQWDTANGEDGGN